MPVLILSMKGSEERRPAIVFLHSTHKNKEWLRPLLEVVNQIVFFLSFSVYWFHLIEKTMIVVFFVLLVSGICFAGICCNCD